MPSLSADGEAVRREIQNRWSGDTLVIRWTDRPPGGFLPAAGLALAIEKEEAGEWRPVVWDDDHEVEVRWMASPRGTWEARWTPCAREAGSYRVRLLPRAGSPEQVAAPAGIVGGRLCRAGG